MAEKYVQGQKYSRSFTAVDVEGKVVEIEHVTTCSDGKVHMKYRLDMSGVEMADILEQAARNINIQGVRPVLFRNTTVDDVIALDGQTIDAAEYLKRERKRGPVTPQGLVTKLRKMGMSTKDIIELAKNTKG